MAAWLGSSIVSSIGLAGLRSKSHCHRRERKSSRPRVGVSVAINNVPAARSTTARTQRHWAGLRRCRPMSMQSLAHSQGGASLAVTGLSPCTCAAALGNVNPVATALARSPGFSTASSHSMSSSTSVAIAAGRLRRVASEFVQPKFVSHIPQSSRKGSYPKEIE